MLLLAGAEISVKEIIDIYATKVVVKGKITGGYFGKIKVD